VRISAGWASLGSASRMASCPIEYSLRLTRLYAHTTLAYGFTRAVTYNYEGQRDYFNERTRKYEPREKLVVDKLASVSGGTFAALFLWPRMLGQDMARLECYLRGKDASEYGE